MNYRKSLISGCAAFLLLVSCALSFAQAAGNFEQELAAIQAAIRQKGAQWVAGETSLSRLSWDEWKMRVGVSLTQPNAPHLPEPIPSALPASLDWRSYNGDYVTGIRDQKKCGSCWAFAMTAGLESYVLVTRHEPGTDMDLSEQVMLSCSGAGSCRGGTLDADYLRSTGLPPEKYYPYTAADGACSNAAPDWQKAAYQIGAWASVSQKLSAIKAALATYGPLPIAFMVYEDFMHYKSGIYSYAAGKKLGGHAVLLVGYNDAEQYFIVKNSWGDKWGEDGFFKIAYSELNRPVDFGIITIAYQAQSEYPQGTSLAPVKRAARHLSADEALKHLEPLLRQKP